MEDICFDSLNKLVVTQLQSLFLPLSEVERRLLTERIQVATNHSLYCYSHTNNKYYFHPDKTVKFDFYHSAQYGIFLYFLSHELREHDTSLASRIYYLNKIMNGLDLYFEVKMPSVFSWEHPIGSVIGRAIIGERFTIYQNCTVGGSFDSDGNINYPTIGENVIMFSSSTVLGNATIGNNTILASHSYVLNETIPDNSIVFGQSPNLVIKKNTKNLQFFL